MHYKELLEKCWDENPKKKRPSASEIYETISNWKTDVKILSEFTDSDNEICIISCNIDGMMDNDDENMKTEYMQIDIDD
ncbi:11602_t:CDS:2 [Dentiscutata heterogama]|uniref:11602_t:CDS:1 n=1 Tax=Dentiscutata heterogama TaxID=1316150 RepID=A0ACA9LZS7_9GLOM|nr:11602_t:CDS:2 [Dentiscutata heterogama]